MTTPNITKHKLYGAYSNALDAYQTLTVLDKATSSDVGKETEGYNYLINHCKNLIADVMDVVDREMTFDTFRECSDRVIELSKESEDRAKI